MQIPLVVLAVLVADRRIRGNAPYARQLCRFSDFLPERLAAGRSRPSAGVGTTGTANRSPPSACFVGIVLAYRWFLPRPGNRRRLARTPVGPRRSIGSGSPTGASTGSMTALFVRPFGWLARIDRDDFIDSVL